MRDILRQIARLERERAHGGAGAEHGLATEEHAEAQAAAHAKLAEFIHAVCAEKAAGDVRGVASRQIAGVLAELERRA